MTDNLCRPCDFSIRHMYDPFHGNVDIEFNDGTKMKVNSLILSWKSSTFCYFFDELRLTNVEIKDFSKEAVISFLEGLYSGDIQLTKGLFREIYKLSLVFKTKCLTDRCTKFFYLLCENIWQEYQDLCFVFNEALYAFNILKTEGLIDMVVGRFIKIDNIKSIFVEPYLKENYASISSLTLDYLLLISKEDYLPILKTFRQNLIDEEIDQTTRSLLSNSKIVECFANNVEHYEEVYELLTLKTGNMTVDDLRMLTNLNLCVIKATKSNSKTDTKQVVLVQSFPNFFYDWKLFKKTSVKEIVRVSSCIFVVIELYCIVGSTSSRIELFFQDIALVCATRSLCRVPSTFIHRLRPLDKVRDFLTEQTVVSEDDTVVIVGTETTLNQLVTTKKLYRLYFQHPAAPPCEKHTECGFMLKVTPCSKEEAGKFNIQLVTEDNKYPADIHCHSEVIQAANMHLVLERYYRGRWYNMAIAWRGKPEYNEIGDVVWDGMFFDNVRVRLVVYYDIRHKK